VPVVAIIQMKGGVGKTTIAANVSGELVRLGRTVRVLDLDPQTSLYAWAQRGEGVLRERVTTLDVHDPAAFQAAVERAATPRTTVVVLDCPPGFPRLAQLAAFVADLALVPVGPSPLDLIAAAQALDVLREAQRGGRRPVIALVPSRVSRTTMGQDLARNLRALGTVLPGVGQRVAIAESVLSGQTAREYLNGRPNPAVTDFQRLARAVDRLL
jgi:chromosome partitioning protein